MAIFHKYPYTDIHDLNLDWILKTVKAMKEKFDSIDFDYIFNSLTSLNETVSGHTESIASIQGDITQIGLDLLEINHTLETQSGDITAIQERINGMSDQISGLSSSLTAAQNDILDLKDDITEMDSTIGSINSAVEQCAQDYDSMDARVSALEEATIGQLQPSTVPKNLCIDLTQGYDEMNVEIVKDETGKTRDSITYNNTGADPTKYGFSFDYNPTDFNACHLRAHNVCIQEMTQDSSNYVPTYTIAWLSDRYTNIYGYSLGRAFATIRTLAQLLAGVTLNVGDYQLAYIQMVDSETNPGVYYDLLLYPQYNGEYNTYNTIFKELYVFNSSGILIEGVQGTYSKRWMLQKYKPAWVPEILGLIKSNADTSSLTESVSQLQTDVQALDDQINDEDDPTSIINRLSGIDTSISSIDNSITGLNSAVEDLDENEHMKFAHAIMEDIPEGVTFDKFLFVLKGRTVFMQCLITLTGSALTQFNQNNALVIGSIRSAVASYFTPELKPMFFEGLSFRNSSSSSVTRYSFNGAYNHGTVLMNPVDSAYPSPFNSSNSIPARAIMITDDGDNPTNKDHFMFSVSWTY